MSINPKYRAIVGAGTKAAGLAGVPGALVPIADVALVASIWSTMLVAVVNKTGRTVDRGMAAKAIAGALGGAGAYFVSCKLYTAMFNFVPGVGTLVSMGVNSVLDYVFTYYFGAMITRWLDTHEWDQARFLEDVGSLAVGVVSGNGIGFIGKLARDLPDMLQLAREPVDAVVLAELKVLLRPSSARQLAAPRTASRA